MAEHAATLKFGRNGNGSQELTPLESVMWRVGQDPTLRMTVGVLLFLDRAPDVPALRERMAKAMAFAPRLRRRPEPQPGARGRPVWVEDRDESPASHLRSLSMSGVASRGQLLELVALLEALPFDPERSPWDLTLVEGIEGGRAALYARAHHVLTDGIRGVQLLGLLLDEPTSHGDAVTPASPAAPAASVSSPQRPVGTITLTVDVPAVVRRFVDRLSAARDFDPIGTAMRGAQRALDVANSASRQLLVTGSGLAAHPARRSLLSDVEVFSVDGARPAAVALGGSRNDLLVAAVAAGLGAYLERRGTPSSELRLVTPTAQRHGESFGGNWFTPARLTVPTAVGRYGPQFGIIVERLAQARREPALRMVSRIATTLGRLPSSLLLPAMHSQARSVDFAATALPGIRTERRLCGATIESAHPLGPRLGCPLNVTALGNSDRLDVGISLDKEAFSDREELVRCLRQALDDYCAAATGEVRASAV
jgi:WS/DGAT/MGAT family acyltransferase